MSGTYIDLNELLADVVYFKAPPNKAYLFVLDKLFRVVYHPLLPLAVADSSFVEITEIERRYNGDAGLPFECMVSVL